MELDFAYVLRGFLSSSSLDTIVFAFFFSFIVWEIPRATKMLSEEWSEGIYPDKGRTLDIFLLLLGLGAFLFLKMSMAKLVFIPESLIMSVVVSVGLVALPIVILLGFIGRIFSRMDTQKESGALFAHTILDFFHTLFFITLICLLLPCAALIIMPFL
jgi:hypothetical protein